MNRFNSGLVDPVTWLVVTGALFVALNAGAFWWAHRQDVDRQDVEQTTEQQQQEER